MVLTRVRKPSALLFDVSGTVTKSSLIDKMLFPFVKYNVKRYFEENWDTPLVRADIAGLRAACSEDLNASQISELEKPQMLEVLENYVIYCMDKKKESRALSLLRFHTWFDGYQKNRLETPVYSDVAIKLQKWRNELHILLYVFSNEWSEATKRFLEKTNHGDLNLLIEEHFDTRMEPLNSPETFRKVVEKIKQPAGNVLFLSKDGPNGRAARGWLPSDPRADTPA